MRTLLALLTSTVIGTDSYLAYPFRGIYTESVSGPVLQQKQPNDLFFSSCTGVYVYK